MGSLVALGLLALAALVAALAPRAVDGFDRRLARQLRRARGSWRWALALAIAAFAGESLVALAIGAPVPHVHDEQSYLLAGDTYAHGRLANPTHPLYRPFETFHVLLRPTYASKYPPGQGLALAAGERLGSPILGVWLAGALFMAAAVWMLHGWLRPPMARLAALLLLAGVVLATPWSQGYWGGFVAALGGALVLGAVPRLAGRARARDGLLLGVGGAILVASRPYEGLVTALGALVLLAAWRRRRVTAPAERRAVIGALLAAGACVLVAVAALAYENWRVTGDPLLLPYQLHDARFLPMPLFLWQPLRTPLEVPPEPMATFYRTFEMAGWRDQHTLRGWLRASALKSGILVGFYAGVALLPVLVALALPARRRDALAPSRPQALSDGTMPWRQAARGAALVALALLASQLVIEPSRPHYVAPGTAAFGVLLAIGWRRLRTWRPGSAPFGRRLAALLPLVVLALVPVRAAALHRDADDWALRRARIDRALARRPGRQLVLVSYGRAHDAQAEWVANGADLFGARVLWARALSPAEDCRLLAFERDRTAWLLRVEEELTPPRLVPYPRSACSGAAGAVATPNRTRRPATDQGSASSRRSASG